MTANLGGAALYGGYISSTTAGAIGMGAAGTSGIATGDHMMGLVGSVVAGGIIMASGGAAL